MRRPSVPILLVGMLAGCGNSSSRRPVPPDETTHAAASMDSLVLTLPDSTGVWLVAGREDTSGSGETCSERLLELRRKDQRLPVPLLYTRGTPEAINDSTLRAALYRHCEVQAWYLVNTRSGLPRPERES